MNPGSSRPGINRRRAMKTRREIHGDLMDRLRDRGHVLLAGARERWKNSSKRFQQQFRLSVLTVALSAFVLVLVLTPQRAPCRIAHFLSIEGIR